MAGCQKTYKNKPVSGLVKLHAHSIYNYIHNYITLHIYVFCIS